MKHSKYLSANTLFIPAFTFLTLCTCLAEEPSIEPTTESVEVVTQKETNLETATFHLKHIIDALDTQDPDIQRKVYEQIYTVFNYILYSKTGIKAASEEGRTLLFEMNTGIISIVEFPANIKRIERFISDLPRTEDSGENTQSDFIRQVCEDLTADGFSKWQVVTAICGLHFYKDRVEQFPNEEWEYRDTKDFLNWQDWFTDEQVEKIMSIAKIFTTIDLEEAP